MWLRCCITFCKQTSLKFSIMAQFSNRNVLFIGITGASCSGKTTVAKRLRKLLSDDGHKAIRVEQDDFFRPENELEYIPEMDFSNWDQDGAIDFGKLNDSIDSIIDDHFKENITQLAPLVVIIDGHVILQDERIRDRLNLVYFLSLDRSVCAGRRAVRVFEPNPPGYHDPEGYFDRYYWPYYQQYKSLVETLNSSYPFQFNDVSDQMNYVQTESKISTEVRQLVSNDWVTISEEKFQINSPVDFVTDKRCGAIATFYGTTRDNFEGKEVVKLVYEAYRPMAMAKMTDICKELRTKWPEILRIAILHRIGDVPPPEISVVIAVSSPHRSDALAAVQYAIDKLKETVPIWKKEEYSDGETSWKENCSCTEDKI